MKHRALNFSAVATMTAILGLTGILAACGGGGGGGGGTMATASFTVGGKVSGLLTGNSVVLLDNGGNATTVGGNVPFTFSSAVTNAAGYAVTVKTQPAGQTCAVTNGSGTISGANVTNVAVTCSDNNYNVAVTVTGLLGATSMVLQDNGADNLTIAANGTVNFNKPAASGSRYAVTVLTQPAGQNCMVAGGSGSIVAANVSVSVACSKATTVRYGFTADYSGLTVSTYSFDAATGRVTLIGMVPNGGGGKPIGVTVHPSGQFVYVANGPGANVSQFRLGVDGTLLPLIPATVAAGSYPASVTIDPSGRFAYVANDGSTGLDGLGVYQFTIGADGGLVPMTVPTVATGANPAFMAVDPSGRFAYVANSRANTISQYAIGANGELQPLTPATMASGPRPLGITIDPAGKHLYTANNAATNVGGLGVSQYAIGSGGALVPLASPNVAAGSGPASVTLDPSGHFAYVTNEIGNDVSQYTVAADGSLTPMATPTVAAGTFPTYVVVDPSGKFAYVANVCNGFVNCGSVSQYSIDSAGGLQPLAPGSIANHGDPASIAFATGNAAVTTTTAFAYVTTSVSNAGGSVQQYQVATDGTLTAVASLALGGTVNPLGIALDPVAPYAYVTDRVSGNVLQFQIGTGGVLSPLAASSAVVAPGAHLAVVDPSGKFLYVMGERNGIFEYAIQPNGSLSSLGNALLAFSASFGMVIDPSGRFLYATGFADNVVAQFSIGADGVLVPLTAATVLTDAFATGACVDPSGTHLYVAAANGYVIDQFAIGPDGSLASLSPASASTPGSVPFGLVIDPSGSYVYASAVVTNDAIFQFSVGAGGLLSPLTPASVSVAPGVYPSIAAIDPSGRNLYTLNGTSGDISLFRIGAGGILAPAAALPLSTAAIPTAIAFSTTRQ
jgi:6-phosphogluconolactonase (cycloisomerase 2 family)